MHNEKIKNRNEFPMESAKSQHSIETNFPPAFQTQKHFPIVQLNTQKGSMHSCSSVYHVS